MGHLSSGGGDHLTDFNCPQQGQNAGVFMRGTNTGPGTQGLAQARHALDHERHPSPRPVLKLIYNLLSERMEPCYAGPVGAAAPIYRIVSLGFS